jgi:hypothetical protein
MTIIAIDPDLEKSGVCIINRGELSLHSLSFSQVVDMLGEQNKEDTIVLVEAGWLNKSNWHLHPTYNNMAADIRKAAKIGERIGQNQAVGMKLLEMARHLGLEAIEFKPLAKCWRGPNKKITHEEFCRVTGYSKKRSNQDERDAGLIAWRWYESNELNRKLLLNLRRR